MRTCSYDDNGVVVAVEGRRSYSFFTVAEGISRTLNVPLVKLSGRLKYYKYLKLFFKRPNFIINVGTLSPRKLMLLGMSSRRVIAYIAVEGPFPITKSLQWFVNNARKIIVIAPSEYVRRELALSGLKVFGVIPHGIDINECLATNVKLEPLPQKLKILTVAASLQYRKSLGIRLLFRAWSRLPKDIRREAVIIVKVPSGFGKHISQIASSCGIKNEEYLTLDTYFTYEEILALYRSSDLYVHPTLSDGFGLPALESLACGTPVVVMDAGPWNEVVTRDVGWLVKVSKEVIVREGGLPYRLKIPDVDDLSEKLAEAIECCKGDCETLRRKCVERAEVFNFRKVYGRLKKIIGYFEN